MYANRLVSLLEIDLFVETRRENAHRSFRRNDYARSEKEGVKPGFDWHHVEIFSVWCVLGVNVALVVYVIGRRRDFRPCFWHGVLFGASRTSRSSVHLVLVRMVWPPNYRTWITQSFENDGTKERAATL